jgi:hypothetical protein
MSFDLINSIVTIVQLDFRDCCADCFNKLFQIEIITYFFPDMCNKTPKI